MSIASDNGLYCPFCNGHDIRFTDHGVTSPRSHPGLHEHSTCCYTCGARFANCFSLDSLIKSWKRRPNDPTNRVRKLMEQKMIKMREVIGYQEAELKRERAEVQRLAQLLRERPPFVTFDEMMTPFDPAQLQACDEQLVKFSTPAGRVVHVLKHDEPKWFGREPTQEELDSDG